MKLRLEGYAGISQPSKEGKERIFWSRSKRGLDNGYRREEEGEVERSERCSIKLGCSVLFRGAGEMKLERRAAAQ